MPRGRIHSPVSAGALAPGDIVHLDFTPSAGHEMLGPHRALVISESEFNRRTGLAWVCPISQGEAAAARSGGFLVTLMGTGLDTVGSVQVHQLRVVDCKARRAQRVERVPASVLDEVRSIIATAAGIG